MKFCYLATIVLAAVCVQAVAATALPGTRMMIDWPGLTSAQDITVETPLPDSLNGFLLGNGDINVSVYGPPDCITLQVGKSDIWDYRDGVYELLKTRPPLTMKEQLAWYTDQSNPVESDLNTTKDPVVKPWEDAGRLLMHCPKTAGQIRFRNPGLAQNSYSQRLNIWNADVTASFSGPESAGMRTFVPYQRNVIVVNYNLNIPQQFDIEIARHKDTTGTIPNGPEFGACGRDIWVRYKFPVDAKSYAYLDGFEYVMRGRIVGGKVTSEMKDGLVVAHVTASKPITVLIAVATTRDDVDPFSRALQDLDSTERTAFSRIEKEHRDFWHDYWQKSFIILDSSELLTQNWFLCNYHLGCYSKPGKIAPALCATFTGTSNLGKDVPPWYGNYTWDYNVQQSFWGAYSSNHMEQAIAYNETVSALLPAAKENSRQSYGMHGAAFFACSHPNVTYNPTPLDRTMCLSAWVSQEMWWYYLYSQDQEYLRTQAYPVLRECATFYEDYLTRSPDGKYDVFPTISPEHWGLTPMLTRNKNSLIDLALIKYLMNACVSASEILGVDEYKRPTWNRIAQNLREYPTTDTPEGKVFVDVEGAPVITYNIPVPITAIFPGNDIGLHSAEPIKQIALRTAMSMGYWGANKYVILMMARARMGVDVLEDFEKKTRELRLRNGGLKIEHYLEEFYCENFGAPIVINESIVQSYTGRIHLAPTKLKTGVRFARLRTEGAFLVSGEIEPGGRISYFSVTSEAGKPCTIVKPWDGQIRVRDFPQMKPVTFTDSDGALSFQTKKGVSYVIDRPDDPWERRPVVRIGGK